LGVEEGVKVPDGVWVKVIVLVGELVVVCVAVEVVVLEGVKVDVAVFQVPEGVAVKVPVRVEVEVWEGVAVFVPVAVGVKVGEKPEAE
jgi:hypothetical protein